MQEFIASFGISETFFDYLVMPLLIFFARVVDVSINTLRIMFVLNGKKTIAPILGFFEAFIWLLAIGQIFQNISNPMSYIAYAGGFATGTYVGMVIEERLALGRVLVRIITPEPLPQLVEYMKERGFRFTSVGAEGRYGKVILMFTVIKREMLPGLINKLKESDEKAFYTIESVKRISEDDLNVMEDKPRFTTRLRSIIRK
ncbi:DUF2179 domain-containing protein [Cyclobacterium marinum]|uniref:UPF0316 protein Cycma_1448 n=1 Tax=Cyclobacterium marinum (strain ATCC 25205 / DSM 745 / LMG 13164 / NCIMB 1802) TaxID=880070 RepID=G0J3L1_CYCMS|nr:DUF2179 domain-containing protein [Cyclobacterium marinum]AEL25217.1 UPF0316 protein [Cyclobacterium marinum DSM 745]MBI0400711.1 DUF2179 domain-containing protein [Cyclobacterium marinum]MBR9773854.1 DUF2179 domain-containing protein [Cytophagales bacterium]|tara:strand:+ start:22066 stop:22668 length:603 start_codon:yes stop_codon:yes gene_type:complete